MKEEIPGEIWREKAGAFLIRTAHQLWGKHSEEILALLFSIGFSNKFMKDSLFGWNKKTKTRSYKGFGIEPGSVENFETGSLSIPEGIIIPYIKNKILLKLCAVSFNKDNSTRFKTIEGSSETPFFFNYDKSNCNLIFNPLYGFLLKQEASSLTDIIIIDNNEKKFSLEFESILENYEKVVVLLNDVEKLPQNWDNLLKKEQINIIQYNERNFKEIIKEIKMSL